MNKFNIGDRVRIVGFLPEEDFEEELKKYRESEYGKCLGTVTTVTAIENVPWNKFDYFYRVESNPLRWYAFELELMQDEININEESVFELFQLEKTNEK